MRIDKELKADVSAMEDYSLISVETMFFFSFTSVLHHHHRVLECGNNWEVQANIVLAVKPFRLIEH